MKRVNKNRSAYMLLLLLIPLMSHAEIYKWVDDSGVTQYSQTKPTKNNTTKFKVAPQPSSVKSPEELLQAKEKARRQQIDKENAQLKKAKKPAKKKRPQSVSGGREDGSDASRCALARDVLNGSLRHSNGAPVDAYDRKVANNDLKKFCR